MGHASSEFEIKNSEGVTQFFDETTPSTIGDTLAIPSVADKFIEKFEIENSAPLLDERELGPNIDTLIFYSIDGGVSFDRLFAGQGVEFDPKGTRQILVKSNIADAPFRAKVTFEKFNEDK